MTSAWVARWAAKAYILAGIMTHDRVAISCPECGWSLICEASQMIERLRRLKMLKREAEPEHAYLHALFRSAAGRMLCEQCRASGLVAVEPSVCEGAGATFEDDVDWGDPVACSECGQMIPGERLAVFPDTKFCRTCQEMDERLGDTSRTDYCPRCGALMSLVSGSKAGGLTRYRSRCAECGYRDG